MWTRSEKTLKKHNDETSFQGSETIREKKLQCPEKVLAGRKSSISVAPATITHSKSVLHKTLHTLQMFTCSGNVF